MEETIYITPNGTEVSESVLREKYGDRFDVFLSEGLLKKKDDSELELVTGLSEQPEQDSLKLEIPQKFQEKTEAGKKFAASQRRIRGGISRIPTYIAETLASVATTFNPEFDNFYNSLSVNDREDFLANLGKGIPTFGVSSVLGMQEEGNKKFRQLNEEAQQLESIMEQYDTGIAEDIFSENVGRGVTRLLNEAFGALPSIGLAFVPGGIGLIGAAEAANKSRELQEKGLDLDFKTALNAAGSGIAEGIFENATFKLGRNLFRSVKGLGKNVAKNKIGAVLGGYAKGFGAEGSSEVKTLLTQKLLDATLANDQEAFDDIWREGLDTYIIGGFTGGPLGGLDVGIRNIAQKKQAKAINAIVDRSKYDNVIEAFTREKGQPILEIEQLPIIDAPNSKMFLEGTLFKKVKRNEMTQDEANQILLNYDESVAIYNETLGLNLTREQKIEMAILLKEKRELENLIAGKDPATAKKQRIRIEQINDQLEAISEESGGELTIKEATREDAMKALIEEGELSPTEDQILDKLEQLTKTQEDAISKPSPKKVDIQEPTEDRPEVGVRDTKEPSAPRKVTPEPIKEEAKPAEEIEAEVEVTPSEVERFPTKRIKVTQPYTFGQIEVTFNDEGIVQKIQNKKTRKPVSFNTQRKVEEKILNNVIDVDAGKKAEVPEGITEQEINKFIADNSNNVREIVETIDVETKNIKEKKSQDIIDFNKLIDQGFKFTSESWKKMTGKSPKQSRLGKFWIDDTVDSVTGQPNGLSVEDGWASILARPDELPVDTTSRIDVNDVIKFIQDNSTIAKIKSQKKGSFVKSPTLIDLEIKFEELTGIKPTPRNIEVVLKIPEGRTPLEIAKLEEQAKLKKEAAEPGVFTEKKKGPSPKKLTKPIGKPKQIVLDEAKALKNKLKELEEVSKKAKREGEQKIREQVGLQKKISSLRGQLKRGVKKDKLNVDVKNAVKQFLKFDPKLVSDLDAYISEASQVAKGLKSTKITKTGIEEAPAVNLQSLTEYNKKEGELVEKQIIQKEYELFEALTGIPAKDISLQEIRDILYNNRATEKTIQKDAKKKKEIIKKALNKSFEKYKSLVNSQLKNNTNIFGEPVDISTQDKKIVREFMDIDLNLLNEKESLYALDSLINFATNGTTSGMVAVIKNNEGRQNILRFLRSKIPVKNLGTVGRLWAKEISTLPIVTEYLFNGISQKNKFFKLSGLQSVINGFSKADKQIRDIETNYKKRFPNKLKPNNESFNTKSNNIERGMFAFMRRTIQGSESDQSKEFSRKKRLVRQSYEKLIASGDPLQMERGEIYKSIYDKILKGVKSISEVESKVDPINVDAVKWITNEWSKFYPQLRNVNLNVYNRSLDPDINYTPDIFSKLKIQKVQDLDIPIFNSETSRKIYDKQSGVLKPNQRIQNISERYVNLSFDQANLNSLNRALSDINTAADIQQLKGFIESSDFNKLGLNDENKGLLVERIKKYVQDKRGVDFTSLGNERSLRRLNRVTSFGVSRTLGSINQFIKQMTPFMTTMANSTVDDTYNGISTFINKKDARKWINDSGYSIATRGIGAETLLDNLNTKIGEQANTTFGKAVDTLTKLQKAWLQVGLVSSDVITAKASWLAYYGQAMGKKGIDVFNPAFDWSTHSVDKEAGDYAQQQVDRQQNASDRALQGDLFRSKNLITNVLLKGLMPFSNFVLNMKSRLYSDASTYFSKSSTASDKKASLQSAGGFGLELAVYGALGLAITEAFALASSLMTGDDDEDKKAKARYNRLKGRLQQAFLDVFSPLPVLDEIAIKKFNQVMKLIDKGDDPFQFYEKKESLMEDFGLFSITQDKFEELISMGTILTSGKVGDRKLNEEEMDLVKSTLAMQSLYTFGFLPADVASIIRYNIKYINSLGKNKSKKLRKTSLKDLEFFDPDLAKEIRAERKKYRDVAKSFSD